jgi:16S rRNA U516 pseudouridylate synthase RsuA-like enzyme
VGSAPYTTTTCCFLLDVVTHASSRNYPSSSSSSLLQSTFYNSNKNKNRYDPTLLKISAGRRIGGGIFSNRNFELALASKKQQQQQQQEQEEDSTRTNISSPAKNDQSSTSNIQQTDQQLGIRLNKVFKETHSRRQADDLIASGRVTVNGKPVIHKGGFMVVPYRDIIAVDGVVVKGWESMNGINVPMPSSLANSIGGSHKITSIHQSSQESSSGTSLNTKQFEYVKYFKPLGVICTTDVRIRGNIIDSIRRDGYVPRHRVFPVGRLDKETTGLIILTSDGRLVNSVLRGEMKQPKVYKVMVDGRLGDKHLERLRVSID